VAALKLKPSDLIFLGVYLFALAAYWGEPEFPAVVVVGAVLIGAIVVPAEVYVRLWERYPRLTKYVLLPAVFLLLLWALMRVVSLLET
jgi:hypothetical protein